MTDDSENQRQIDEVMKRYSEELRRLRAKLDADMKPILEAAKSEAIEKIKQSLNQPDAQ